MPSVTKQSPGPKKPIMTKKQSILSRIIDLSDLPEDGIKLLVYGHSGTGKTRFMGSFSEAGPLLHIVCSSNKTNEARSIRGLDNIQVVELQEPEELEVLVDYARRQKVVSVAFDHLTEFCNLVLARILKIDKVPEQNSWGLASQQQYQQMGLQVKEHLRSLLDLPCNVLIAGQQRTYDTVEEAGEIIMPYVSVAATPAVAGWIAPACDYIVQTYKKRGVEKVVKKIGDKKVTSEKKDDEVSYFLRTGPSEVYTTKFRVPPGTVLPSSIKDPSYSKFIELLEV